MTDMALRPEKKRSATYRIDVDLLERLESVFQQTGISRSEIVRAGLAMALRDVEQMLADGQGRMEILEAIDPSEETGN